MEQREQIHTEDLIAHEREADDPPRDERTAGQRSDEGTSEPAAPGTGIDPAGVDPGQETLPLGRAGSPGGDPSSEVDTQPLLGADETGRYKEQWINIQTEFVDKPRRSVEQADALVADLMQQLATSFSDERRNLEGQWDRGDDVSTEDLRVALQRYRSFFDRLLAA